MKLKLKLGAILMCLFAVSAAHADWINFAGWDESTVTAGGQTFLDVCDDVDVTVTGTANSYTTSFSGSNIMIGGNTDASSFTFTFSSAVDVTMDIHTLDPDEYLTITGGVPANYTHISGASPTESGNLTLSGNGYGINSTGASHGEIALGNITTFTVDYEALKSNKFDRFSVGCSQAVPEPNAMVLLLVGGMVMFLGRRCG